MFTQNEAVIWVELHKDSVTRRLALPNMPNILNRLSGVLSQYPGLRKVREGMTTATAVTPLQPAQETFAGLPFQTTSMMSNVQLMGHPDLPAGDLRISNDFIEAVLATDPMNQSDAYGMGNGYQAEKVPAPQTVDESKLTPDELIRHRLSQPKVETVAASTDPVQMALDKASAAASAAAQVTNPAPPAQQSVPSDPPKQKPNSIPPPPASGEDELRAQIAKQNATRRVNGTQSPRPLGENEMFQGVFAPTMVEVGLILEKIYEEIRVLQLAIGVPNTSGDFTGRELQKWFAQSAVDHGYDRTFEALARKMHEAPGS